MIITFITKLADTRSYARVVCGLCNFVFQNKRSLSYSLPVNKCPVKIGPARLEISLNKQTDKNCKNKYYDKNFTYAYSYARIKERLYQCYKQTL